MNYDQLKYIVRNKDMDGEDATRFAHFATRYVLDARQARRLHEELVVTLGNVSVAHWLGPTVAETLRERAASLIDDIERAAVPNLPLLTAGQQEV